MATIDTKSDNMNTISANPWPMLTTSGTPQFGILYNGSMYVYDGIPAEKMHEIMMMASANAKSCEMKSGIPLTSLFSSSGSSSSPQGTSTTNLASPQSVCFPPPDKTSICRIQEFPLARRQSLQRFLEKRRTRVVNKAPYSPSSSKMANNIENNLSSGMVPLESK